MKKAGWRILCLLLFLALVPWCASGRADGEASPVTTGTWKGSYLGTRGGTAIERQLTLHIDLVRDDGTFEGIANLEGETTGSYYLDGTWQPDGTFSFQGTEWLVDPGNFSLNPFAGTVTGDQMTGLVNGNEAAPFTLTKIAETFQTTRIELDQIPKSWKGEYDGWDADGTVVRRNYAFHINEIASDGQISGTAEFTPSDKAPARYGYTGAYYFGGTVDARTGKIRMQGNKWNLKPTDNFDFVILNGRIQDAYRTIDGTSEKGIWTMEAVDAVDMSLYVDDDRVLYTRNGHRYHVYAPESVTTWAEAVAYCEGQGGHLATIASQRENDDVYGYLRLVGCAEAYIGLTDAETEGEWR